MLNTKILEVRDRMTYIPVTATRLDPSSATLEIEKRILKRVGYLPGCSYTMISKLDGLETRLYDHEWGSGARTMGVAHRFIDENWDTLDSGDVIDVEFILGETTEKKKSEVYGVR